MGAGIHGGFGKTSGTNNHTRVKLPNTTAQIKHIFSDRPGHLPDTPENRKILTDLANDKSKYVGTDKYGNSWHEKTKEGGAQYWVRHRDGKINEGGKNDTPRIWNEETGYNNNPVKRRKK